MISRENLPRLIQYVRGGMTNKRNSYYGINVSSNIGLEPIDQLDGFLVAKYIQQLFGQQQKFYPYIAGVYNALNARSPKEATKIAEKRKKADREKKALLERVVQQMEIEGSILTTYDLWEDESYWKVVDRLFAGGIYESIPDEQKTVETIRLNEFPLEVLGKMKNVVKNVPLWIRSGSFYVPIEVAEAVWLRDRYGIEWKIGPPSEEVYDQFIQLEGIGIIRTKQPRAIENGSVRSVMPYIGKSTQPQRILFSDTQETLYQKCFSENPSFEWALELSRVWEEISGRKCSDDIQRVLSLINLGKQSD